MKDLTVTAVGNCGMCKHWDPASEHSGGYHRRLPDWGECTAIGQSAYQAGGAEEDDDDALAILSDGSGYFASLATRPTFGCVLWAAKE